MSAAAPCPNPTGEFTGLGWRFQPASGGAFNRPRVAICSGPCNQMFFKNVSAAGGPAPARAYVPELLPDVMEGRINPGRGFDRTIALDGVPDGYRAMNEREALKVMIRP